jgi:hypothetical protein
MNMENKYFTPDIEDFYVGYEFETKMYGEDDTWVKCIYSKPTDELFCKDSDDNIWVNDSLRVPYLTKEQIEAEGWTDDTASFQKPELFLAYQNSSTWRKLVYRFSDNMLQIVEVDDSYKYSGNCKDINTFRKIIKLLNIN